MMCTDASKKYIPAYHVLNKQKFTEKLDMRFPDLTLSLDSPIGLPLNQGSLFRNSSVLVYCSICMYCDPLRNGGANSSFMLFPSTVMK